MRRDRQRRRLRWLGALAILAVVAAAAAAVVIRRGQPPTPAAVVLITIDTLRADALWQDGARPETPFLDALAAGGVIFDAAYATSSWTAPSMASLFTSLPPSSHGVTGLFDEVDRNLEQHILPPSLTTLAESFQGAGFVTLGMPANLHLSHELGFAQGFDYYAGQARFVDARQLNNKVRLALIQAFGNRWRRQWRERRSFLWIHYFDPHFPYVAREPWATRYAPHPDPQAPPLATTWPELLRQFSPPTAADAARLRPRYASEISFVDEQLRLLNDRLDLDADDVLLIVTADHGEEFAEHGGLGHGHTLHEELVRVPLLVRWPAGIAGGRRIATPVSLLDVYPTLLELAGLSPRGDLTGRSLAGALRGDDAAPPPIPVFAELLPPRGNLRAVRDGRWKLIQRQRDHVSQLFDLAADPGEQRDLAGENADVVQQLDALLTGRAQSQPAPPSDAGATVANDPATRERMRALGY